VQRRPKHERRPPHNQFWGSWQAVSQGLKWSAAFFLPIIMENSRWSFGNNHGDRPRANLITHYNGEPKRELCHHHGDRPLVDSIYKVCQGHGLPTQDHGEPKRELCHHYGDRPLVDSIYKVCQGHGLPTQDHGEPKRELCHHYGNRLLADSFIPMPMESPRGSSAIIIEFRRRTHLI